MKGTLSKGEFMFPKENKGQTDHEMVELFKSRIRALEVDIKTFRSLVIAAGITSEDKYRRARQMIDSTYQG
jgi:hypothetical protein